MSRSKSIFIRFLLLISILLSPYVLSRKLIQADATYTTSDTIDDSRPSNDTSHEIYFVTPSGVESSTDTITLEFDDGGTNFDLTSVDDSDMDLAFDADDDQCDGSWTELTLGAAAGAGVWGINVNTSTDIITITAPTDAGAGEIPTDRCVQIEIGDNATGGTGNEEINNPSSAAIYDIIIDGTFGDDGLAKVVVIDTLTAQVTVSETLSFVIAGVNLATCDDRPGDNVNEVATTVGTSVDFGSVTTEEFYDACHSLTIGTNASGGYLVTVKESDQLTFGGSTIADGTCEGACDETTGAVWDTSSFNGFGYCLDDITGDGGATADAGFDQCDHATTPEYKIFPEHDQDTPDEEDIMESAGALSTNDETHLGYRISVDGSQAAGTYQNNIILVATPTY